MIWWVVEFVVHLALAVLAAGCFGYAVGWFVEGFVGKEPEELE